MTRDPAPSARQTPPDRDARFPAVPKGALAFGGDYNPEQWPEEVWTEDVALMREAGVNLVSVGIFSWALLEPREGEFAFGWLDRVVGLLHEAGIAVDLATPTASPPAWFFAAHPEARVVARDGRTLGFGSRGIAAPTSPAYRAAAVRIAGELARRYGEHPAVVLWHVHNEYGAPVTEDYSASAALAWPRWLRERYGSLEALNAAWGTAFWGQSYLDWDHVATPADAPSTVNPAQRLDFARFSDDQLRACFVAERDEIRRHSDRPVTTNFMAGMCPGVDLWKWAGEVDVVSNDHYLDAADERPEVGLALSADLTRSLAGGRPWILMEHSTSAVNWQPRNVAKTPGQMARNSFSHLARGADGILFFQWRAGRSGAEKFHSAMLPHAGPRSRVFREVCELGAALGRLEELRGSRVRADAAILWDWESFWAQDLEWRPSVDLLHRERVDAYYDALWRDNVTVDFAHPEADLRGYRLVVAPASYLLTNAAAENLTAFVRDGGTLVVSCFSAIVDEHDAVHPGGFMAPLRRCLDVGVEEFLPLREGQRVHVRFGADDVVSADVWADDLDVAGATVVAAFLDGPAAGQAAVTRHEHGRGTGWYVSPRLDVDGLARVLAGAYDDAGLAPSGVPGVEVVRRRGTDHDYVVAVNHTDDATRLALSGTELLDGTTVDGGLDVEPGGIRVLRTARGET